MLPLSLCGLAQAWSVRGTPSRGGPGGSSLAGLRGRAAGAGSSGALRTRVVLGSTASSHRECICARSPLLCSQGIHMCSLKGPFCDVCRARGPSLDGPGGWFLCPLAMARRRRWCQRRAASPGAWVCTLREGNPQGTIKRSVLGSRGTIKRSVSGDWAGRKVALCEPTRSCYARGFSQGLAARREAAGREPQIGVLVLAVARGFSAANLVVSAKCAAAGRPFWRPHDGTQARAAAAAGANAGVASRSGTVVVAAAPPAATPCPG